MHPGAYAQGYDYADPKYYSGGAAPRGWDMGMGGADAYQYGAMQHAAYGGHPQQAEPQRHRRSHSRKEKSASKKARSRSRPRRRRSRAREDVPSALGVPGGVADLAPLIPDKDTYMRLLGEMRGWSDLKKRNLILNTYATLGGEGQRAVQQGMRPHKARRVDDGLFIPPPQGEKDSESALLAFANLQAPYECKVARLPEGSYVIASRLEWGYFAVYRKPVQANSSPSSNVLASFSRKNSVPTWEELGSMNPVLIIVFLEITQLTEAENIIKVTTLNAEKSLKLQFAIKDFEQARVAIKAGHVQCRAQKRIQGSRHPAVSEFYVDGEEFFPCLGDALMSAQTDILMAAWWLSPYVFLKRSKEEPFDQNYRLDNLLQRKALEGVRVYILLYQEIERATALTSLHTKQYLESLHPRIKVLRHRGPASTSLVFTHHQKFTVVDWRVLFIGGLDPCYGRWDTSEHPLFDNDEKVMYPGLDYRNPVLLGDEATSQTKTPFLSALNRRVAPRLPWHDIHVRLEGKVAYAAGLNFVQRWHHHCRKNGPEAQMIVPDISALYNPRTASLDQHKTVETTLYRSMGEWSGNRTNDKGIETAYLDLIRNATDYIYLENQYFISSVYGSEVSNKIAQALVDKIIEAHQDNRQFRCLMMIQPHGEGDPVADQFIRSIIYFQNQTLLRMQQALLQTLGSKEVLERYLMVGYIQQHGRTAEGQAVFSPIYIHSKFIVADDMRFIVGSANINDRSFNGDRDSELAVLVAKPADLKDGLHYCSRIRDLRIRLWTEHFALPAASMLEPTSDELWARLRAVMTGNTQVYESVFPAAPTNRVTTLEDAQRQSAKPPNDELVTTLSNLKGHAVLYPAQWMSNVLPTLVALAAGTHLLV